MDKIQKFSPKIKKNNCRIFRRKEPTTTTTTKIVSDKIFEETRN
jgi:hypothetical protein